MGRDGFYHLKVRAWGGKSLSSFATQTFFNSITICAAYQRQFNSLLRSVCYFSLWRIGSEWKGEEGRGTDYGAVVSRTLHRFPPTCWLSFQILPFLSRFGLNAKSDVGRVHAVLTFSGAYVREHTQHRRESFLRNFTSCTLDRVLSLFKLTSLFRHFEFLAQRLYFRFFQIFSQTGSVMVTLPSKVLPSLRSLADGKPMAPLMRAADCQKIESFKPHNGFILQRWWWEPSESLFSFHKTLISLFTSLDR